MTNEITTLSESQTRLERSLFAQPEANWKPYQTYRETDIEWVGKIPQHWDIRRLKYVFRVVNGSTPSSNVSKYWDGPIAWATPDDLGQLKGRMLRTTRRSITQAGYDNCGATWMPPGSLVLSTRAPIGHLAIAGIPLCTNQGCRGLIPRFEGESLFLYYLLLAARPKIESLGQGSTFEELSKNSLESVWLPVPPRREQQAIAAFLDRETDRIDTLIAKKERLIELLQEKRTVLISEVVTKGLDPDVEMKDSGVEWIGKIPNSWTAVPVKYVTSFVTSGSRGWAEFYDDEGAMFIRVGNLSGASDIKLDLSEVQRVMPPSNAEGKRTQVRRGDVLVAITGATIGSVSIVPKGMEEAYVNQHVALVRPVCSRCNPKWLAYSIFAASGQAQVHFLLSGGTKQGLGLDDIRELVITLPPVEIQNRIVNTLNNALDYLNKVESAVEGTIVRLQEYRAALISAAVTGKIDVREPVNDSLSFVSRRSS